MSVRSIPTPFKDAMNRKTVTLAEIVESHWQTTPKNLLVVGCGTGDEAGVLARRFNIKTIGIDIGDEFAFDRERAAPAKLEIMDAHALTFPDSSFDFVYSFHALEHMSDPQLALREMSRVLKPGGTYVIGTPNKARLIGYIGSATSLWNKIKWNVNDWMDRLSGQWSNEAGAHAGFTETELLSMCAAAFGPDTALVTDRYYLSLYGKKRIKTLIRLKLSHRIFPCVYIVGTRWGGMAGFTSSPHYCPIG